MGNRAETLFQDVRIECDHTLPSNHVTSSPLRHVYTVGYYLIFIPMYWYTLGRGALRFMRAWERQSNNYSARRAAAGASVESVANFLPLSYNLTKR